MVSILNAKKALNIFILINTFFVLVKSSEIIDLSLNDFEANYTKNTFFHISPNSTNISNYIKIEVLGNNPKNKYIIAYYKDESFNNREQLSQSTSGKAFMFLNKQQIKNDFYLSVECPESSWEYSFKISLEENIDLNAAEPYSYYVTKDNKETNFTLHYNSSKLLQLNYKNTYFISIWVKGNKNINVEFSKDGKTYIKHPKFHGYILQFVPKEAHFTINCVVKGEESDLINIGFLVFNEYHMCLSLIDFGAEYSIFLNRATLQDAFFLFEKQTDILTNSLYVFNHDYEFSDYVNSEASTVKGGDQYFLRMDPYENDSFYSLQYIEYSNASDHVKYDYYPPQILGSTYQRNLIKDEIIGLIPMKPGKDYNYLTYNVAVKEGMFKAFIYKCDNYPFCSKDIETLKKSTQLLDFNSASISYNKNEYDDTISPISKNQNMLLLTCESESCKLFTSMYTDKNKINLILSVPYYKYIRKSNEDNYIVSIQKEILNSFFTIQKNVYVYLNVEKLSGNVTITSQGHKEVKKKKGKKLYIIDATKLDNFNFKIKGFQDRDSAYSISASIHTDEMDILTPQINYLLKSNVKENSLLFADEPKAEIPYYFGFYSLGCNIEVENTDSSAINNGLNFYQDYHIIDNKTKSVLYKANKNKNENNCLFGTSMYKLYDENNELNSMVLANGAEYPFLFNEKYNTIKYMQIIADKNKDIEINININDNKTDYNMHLLVNDTEVNTYNISRNENITINSTEIKDMCQTDTQPCKINYIINAVNIKDNSSISIVVNKDEYENEDYEENENKEDRKEPEKDNTLLYIIIGVVGGIIIIALIVLLLYIKYRKKTSGNIDDNLENIKKTDEMSLLEDNS